VNFLNLFVYVLTLFLVNLYGYSMSQALPTHDFQWIEDFDSIDFTTISDNSSVGYFIECDLVYPEHLHESHASYPLCPTPLTITRDMLSAFQQEMKPGFKQSRKLCANFLPKEKVVLHYKAFQLYTSLGMEVTHIHRVLSFQQSKWLEPYIRFNNDQRKIATSDFQKSFYKLMNNAYYGRTLMNKRKHTTIEVVTCLEKAISQLAKPTIDSFSIITENLILLRRKQRNIKLNCPIYIGFSILDYAKTRILDFHYNTMMKIYTPQNLSVCMSDTDSFLYHIQTINLNKDLASIAKELDTSNYRKDHPLYSEQNKGVLGKFKNELPNQHALEFYGLKPKLYAIKLEECEKKVGKGIKRSVLQNEVNFEHYKNVYDTQNDFYVRQNSIRSEKHTLYTSSQRKLALSCFNDKMYMVSNEECYPFGDYRIDM
jgi:hypothetical protein